MKRILFCCFIALMPCTLSFAQNVSRGVTTVTDKAQLQSRINEIDASLGRLNEARAQAVFNEVKASITQHLSDSKKALHDIPASDRAAAMEKFNKEQTLYLQIVDLSKNMQANRAALHSKLTEYNGLMQ